MKRTHGCGELRRENVNEKVTLIGWVAKRRNLGSLVFIDLRDRSGICQITFDETMAGKVQEVRSEFILQVSGTVQMRGAANPKIEYAEYSTLDAVKESLPQAAKPASDNAIAWTNQLYINQMRNYVLADDAAAYQPFRKQAFSKLKTFQHSDGGLQWFPGMESSTMVTLYFLEKAGQLRSVGAFTPEEDELKLIRRALDYIDGRIALQGTYKEFRPFTLVRDFAVRSLWFDIPMREDARSLNLSNSVAILLYEALRQQGFPGLSGEGHLHHTQLPGEDWQDYV